MINVSLGRNKNLFLGSHQARYEMGHTTPSEKKNERRMGER